MVSMKQEHDDGMCAPCPPEAYPYGLRICLNDKACEALGIKGMISTGTKLSVRAQTVVVMCREEGDVEEPKSEIYLDLQITDMEIAAPNSMYPNSMMKD